jgi:protoporphyrinogen IX oxidase
MMYFYIKALHIIFVVTWFAGMFYIVRLFIYNREANDKQPVEKKILQDQFGIMIKRLWFGITWPSAILALGFGSWMWTMIGTLPHWLAVKLFFVTGLILYHLSLHVIYVQQRSGNFTLSSQRLRIWNELATLFLVAIVMVASVKQEMSWLWGIIGLVLLAVFLMLAIRIYKRARSK